MGSHRSDCLCQDCLDEYEERLRELAEGPTQPPGDERKEGAGGTPRNKTVGHFDATFAYTGRRLPKHEDAKEGAGSAVASLDASRLRALMEGLQIENIGQAMVQAPEVLREIGRFIAAHCKETKAQTNAINQITDKVIFDSVREAISEAASDTDGFWLDKCIELTDRLGALRKELSETRALLESSSASHTLNKANKENP